MRSKTSFFNAAALRKDLTRFSPLWGGYTLCLLMGLLLMWGRDAQTFAPYHLAVSLDTMALVNLGYGFLTAQVLFGDLFNTRMCNALHAMPLRRESWFGSHILAGLLMSLIPTAVMSLAAQILIAFHPIAEVCKLPPIWMAAVNLQYLFFFGIGVLSMFCAGNRVAAATVYALGNFGALLAYCAVSEIYTPMLHGVILQAEPFTYFCPVFRLMSGDDLIRINVAGWVDIEWMHNNAVTIVAGNWWYLWVIAALGVGFIGLSLWLYRRRRLECAGDFLASRKLEPVFMGLFSVSSALVFTLAYQLFGVSRGGMTQTLFLSIGLAAGWFVGRMLLERQVGVFRSRKNWLGLAVMALILGGTLGLTALDPLGIVDRIPDAEEIARVSVEEYEGDNVYRGGDTIAAARKIHELCLETKYTREEVFDMTDTKNVGEIGREWDTVVLSYELKNGRKLTRRYLIMSDSEVWELVKKEYSRESYVFRNSFPTDEPQPLMSLVETPEIISVDYQVLGQELQTKEFVEELFRAAQADCETGTMAQYYAYHPENVMDGIHSLHVEVQLHTHYVRFEVYADSENCLRVLREAGILDEISQRYSVQTP